MATTFTIDFAKLAKSDKIDTNDNGKLVVPTDFTTINERIIWAISNLTDATPEYISAMYQIAFPTYYESNSALLATANLIGFSSTFDYISKLVLTTSYDYQGQLFKDQLPLLFYTNAHARWMATNGGVRVDSDKYELFEDFLTTCIMVLLLKQSDDNDPIFLIDILAELDSECGEFYIDQQDNHGVRFIEFLDLPDWLLRDLHDAKYNAKENR